MVRDGTGWLEERFLIFAGGAGRRSHITVEIWANTYQATDVKHPELDTLRQILFVLRCLRAWRNVLQFCYTKISL